MLPDLGKAINQTVGDAKGSLTDVTNNISGTVGLDMGMFSLGSLVSNISSLTGFGALEPYFDSISDNITGMFTKFGSDDSSNSFANTPKSGDDNLAKKSDEMNRNIQEMQNLLAVGFFDGGSPLVQMSEDIGRLVKFEDVKDFNSFKQWRGQKRIQKAQLEEARRKRLIDSEENMELQNIQEQELDYLKAIATNTGIGVGAANDNSVEDSGDLFVPVFGATTLGNLASKIVHGLGAILLTPFSMLGLGIGKTAALVGGGLKTLATVAAKGFAAYGVMEGAFDAANVMEKADAAGVSKTSAGMAGFIAGDKTGAEGAFDGLVKGAAVGALFGPLGMALGGLAGAIIGSLDALEIAKVFDDVGEVIGDFGGKLLDGVLYLTEAFEVGFKTFWNNMASLTETVPKLVADLPEMLEGMIYDLAMFPVNLANKARTYLIDAILGLFESASKYVSELDIPNMIGDAISDIATGVLDFYKGIFRTITDFISEKLSYFGLDLPDFLKLDTPDTPKKVNNVVVNELKMTPEEIDKVIRGASNQNYSTIPLTQSMSNNRLEEMTRQNQQMRMSMIDAFKNVPKTSSNQSPVIVNAPSTNVNQSTARQQTVIGSSVRNNENSLQMSINKNY